MNEMLLTCYIINLAHKACWTIHFATTLKECSSSHVDDSYEADRSLSATFRLYMISYSTEA